MPKASTTVKIASLEVNEFLMYDFLSRIAGENLKIVCPAVRNSWSTWDIRQSLMNFR